MQKAPAVRRVTGAASRPLYAAGLIVGAMALIGVIDNFVRLVAADVGLWQFHALRSAMAIPMILALCLFAGRRWRPRRWRPALARSALIVASMLLYFGSLPMAPIAQVGAGLFTSPIWVLVFSALIFGERIGARRAAAVAIGFAGVLTILRPWEAGFTPWALLPVAAGALYAFAMIVTRRWCADEPPLALNLMFFTGLGLAGLAGAAALTVVVPGAALTAAAPFFFTGWVWPLQDVTWGVLAMQAAGSVVAVLMMTVGYQSAPTAQLTIFDNAFLISAAAAGYLLWGDRLDGATLAGGGLIILAGAMIALEAGGAGRPRPRPHLGAGGASGGASG